MSTQLAFHFRLPIHLSSHLPRPTLQPKPVKIFSLFYGPSKRKQEHQKGGRWRSSCQLRTGSQSNQVYLDVQLYYVRKQEDGLNIYRCARGTNSDEGSIHQKIVQAFGTFNAGPALADDLLAEFRHRHNEDANRRNRPNYMDFGHYDTWIVDDLQNIMMQLGYPDPFPNWVNGSSFRPTGEKFGIVPLADIPEHMKYDSSRNDGMTPTNQRLAMKMNTRFPFLPIQNEEERRLYRRFLRQSSGQGKPDLLPLLKSGIRKLTVKRFFTRSQYISKPTRSP